MSRGKYDGMPLNAYLAEMRCVYLAMSENEVDELLQKPRAEYDEVDWALLAMVALDQADIDIGKVLR